MQQHMEMNDPLHEQPRATYGQYEGTQGGAYQQPVYEQPNSRRPLDDDNLDLLAQQLMQRMGAGSYGKVKPATDANLISGQRLGLAIVSVVMLVPLSAICLGILGALGLFALGALCVAIVLINVSFRGFRS